MTGNIPDTVVILRDQAEEFPLCQQLYSCQWQSLKVGYMKPKSGTKVGDQNVDRGNREYQVKKDNINIWESYKSPWERMRSRPTTQVGWRSIRKVWKWAEPLEVEVRLQKDMESWGMNHDSPHRSHAIPGNVHPHPQLTLLIFNVLEAVVQPPHGTIQVIWIGLRRHYTCGCKDRPSVPHCYDSFYLSLRLVPKPCPAPVRSPEVSVWMCHTSCCVTWCGPTTVA